MSRESIYSASLRRLRLTQLRPYLESTGWRRTSDYNGALAIFTKQGDALRQLLVPVRPEFDDFLEQMSRVFLKLAESEGRDERSILHDVYAGLADTVRYRTQSLAASRGTVPLDQGISLLEGARRSLLAAACTVVFPERTYHPYVSVALADDFIETCELAQTEEGSFGIVLQCPLQVSEFEPAVAAPPFARKATDTLLTSVAMLVEAIDTDRVDSIVHPERPGLRLTANLCDALTRMHPDDPEGSLDLSVSWATHLPKPNGASLVQIRGELFPKIAEIGKLLRGPAAVETGPFVARVETLAGTEVDQSGQRYGEVRITVFLREEGTGVRARASLDVEKYKLANKAHMDNLLVLITGVLTQSGRSATLSSVTDLRLISDSEAGI